MTTFRRAALALIAVVLALVCATQAQAARVRSLVPWQPGNTYLAKADIDGRSAPQLEPRAAVNAIRKGQWVRISCQTDGQAAYGSTLWDKVGRYFVPDQLLKTYSDGRLQGAPPCAAAPAAPAPAPAAAPRCAPYTVFGLRGSGEPGSGNHGMGATVGPTADTVAAKVGAANVRLDGIPYPAASVDTLLQDPNQFDLSMQLGEIMLRKRILTRIRSCPKTKIAVIGYSQGAGVASETLRHLPASAFAHVRVAALFADTYSAGQTKYAFSFDYFNPNRTTPVKRTGHGVFGARRLPAALRTKFDICFDEDIVCDKSKSNFHTIGQAFLASMHSHYKDWSPGFFSSLTGFVGVMVGNRIGV